MASGWERGSHRRVKQACIRPYTVPSLFFAGRLREAVEGDWGHCKLSVTKLFHSAHSPTHQWYSSVLLQLSPEVLPGLGERAVEVKSTGRTVLNQVTSNQIKSLSTTCVPPNMFHRTGESTLLYCTGAFQDVPRNGFPSQSIKCILLALQRTTRHVNTTVAKWSVSVTAKDERRIRPDPFHHYFVPAGP